MTDPQLLSEAIVVAAGGNASRFAKMLGVSVSSVFAWRAGDRPLDSTVRVLCRLILAEPRVGQVLRMWWMGDLSVSL